MENEKSLTNEITINEQSNENSDTISDNINDVIVKPVVTTPAHTRYIPVAHGVREVRNDIPVPPKNTKKNSYCFDAMEVGESMFIENKIGFQITPLVNRMHKKTDMRFTVRTEGSEGTRVWRTK